MDITKEKYGSFRVFNPFRAIQGHQSRLCAVNPGSPRTAWTLTDESTGNIIDTIVGSKQNAIQRATDILTKPADDKLTHAQLIDMQEQYGFVFGVVAMPKEDIENTMDLGDYLKQQFTDCPVSEFTYDIVGADDEAQTISFYVSGQLEL